MFIPDIASLKPHLVTFLSTAAGRAQLINNYIEPSRASIRDGSTNPNERYGCVVQAAILEAVISRCDGTEQYDRVAVQGLISDMKSLGAGAVIQTVEEREVVTQFNDLVTFIRTTDLSPPSLEDDGA